MIPMKIEEILKKIEFHAPPATAERWDNVGLLLGDPQWKTQGAVVSIDLTERAIEVARAKKYRLIVTHHPCIFPKSQGISQVTAQKGMPGLVFEALRHGIAVISSHTNFDQCSLEVVRSVSTGIGAVPQGRLFERSESTLLKLVVFVPDGAVEAVRQSICEAGAGHIGNYDFCTFATSGEGTFRGGTGTKPFIGKTGKFEKIPETRLETVFPRAFRDTVVKALLRSHPYEEVAYDLYPVEQAPTSRGLVQGWGYGFWGEFPVPRSFSDVLKDVKNIFKLKGFLLTDPALGPSSTSRMRKVAFVAGKGSSFLGAAAFLGCDLFITGEAGYHAALEGARKKMRVLEIGHRESERFFLITMRDWLVKMGVQVVKLDVPTQKFYS